MDRILSLKYTDMKSDLELVQKRIANKINKLLD